MWPPRRGLPRAERYAFNMGCDIHAHVETRYTAADTDQWSHLCDFDFSRNYLLFALMAAVRRFDYLPNAAKLEEALSKRGVKTLDDPLLSEEEISVIVQEGSDTGVTNGQPSFEPKGVPDDISWKTSEEYTLYVAGDDEDGDADGCCSMKSAMEWLGSGSSEVWGDTIDGKVARVTSPDWHSGSWLGTAEMEQVAARMRLALKGEVPDAKRRQKQAVKWARDALDNAREAGDAERIKTMERELERESKWSAHDPMLDGCLAKVEGLVAMMNRLEASGRVTARVVFWFDN